MEMELRILTLTIINPHWTVVRTDDGMTRKSVAKTTGAKSTT
jgi:hypothetical protein